MGSNETRHTYLSLVHRVEVLIGNTGAFPDGAIVTGRQVGVAKQTAKGYFPAMWGVEESGPAIPQTWGEYDAGTIFDGKGVPARQMEPSKRILRYPSMP